MKNNSIRRQLIVYVTSAVTLMWLISITISALIVEDEMNEVFDVALQETAQRLRPFALNNPQRNPVLQTLPNALDPRHNKHDTYLIYQIRNEDGKILLSSPDAPLTPLTEKLVTGYQDLKGRRIYTEKISQNGSFIQAAEPLEHRTEAIRESVLGLVVPLFFSIPLTGLLVLWIVRKSTFPLQQLNEDIKERGTEKLDEFDISNQPEELLPIVSSLNELLKRINLAIEAEREFASNSAHELRTPVAATLAQTQRLISVSVNEDTKLRALEIEAGLKRLQRLSEKLLQLSRADASALRKGENSQILELLDLILDEYNRGQDIHVPIEFTIENLSNLKWPIDMDSSAIVLRNLLENALRYGTADQAIQIFCDHENTLHIVNDCAVLPQVELERLTHRFERGSYQSEGSGLGLAIVETFVKHGSGSLEIYSPAKESVLGFEVLVKFPTQN